MVTIKSSQKIFTEQESPSLNGICSDHLRDLRAANTGFDRARPRGLPGSKRSLAVHEAPT